jgi:hypothetical protein
MKLPRPRQGKPSVVAVNWSPLYRPSFALIQKPGGSREMNIGNSFPDTGKAIIGLFVGEFRDRVDKPRFAV